MKYYTSENCLQLDKLTQQKYGIDGTLLMKNAGKSCADQLIKLFSDRTSTLVFTIVCGPGNNGGDGLAIARELMYRKVPVRVLHFLPRGSMSEALSTHLALLQKIEPDYTTLPLENVKAFEDVLGESPGIVVDALFGVGARMPFDVFWQQVFSVISRRAKFVVSIDHPSGYWPNDGAEPVDPYVHAHSTLSIGLPKFAHYTHAGPEACGQVVMCDAGFPQAAKDEITPFATGVDREQVRAWLSPPQAHVHKNIMGHVGLLAGSSQMPGALSLLVRGALQSGVGKITVFGQSSDFEVFQRMLPPEVMYSPLDQSQDFGETLQSKKISSLVAGPGLSLAADIFSNLITQAVKRGTMLILDAESFRLLTVAGVKKTFPGDSQVAWIGHLGEQQIFFGCESSSQMFLESIERYQDWIKAFPNHIWLRKGLGSVTVAQDQVWLNESGNFGLAKGGSGDFLAGIIGALSLRYELAHAVAAAVWIHGACADGVAKQKGWPGSVTPSECVDYVPKVLSEIY